MHKVGILRGASLNPYEGQCFKKLPEFGFQPIGIMTFDNTFPASEIPFPTRVGHNFKTLTGDHFRILQRLGRKITKYHFESANFTVYGLKKLTKDLDIIHSADIFYPYTYQAVKTGIPTVVTEWENIPFHFEERPYSKYKEYNRKHVAHFIAITEKAKQALITEGVATDKISVIPAGIDCDIFKPTEKDKQLTKNLGISENKTYILFVGRLVPEKGIFSLLTAFSTLAEKIPDVELLIVGSGPKTVKKKIDEHIGTLRNNDKIRFLGGIKYADMPKIHNIADVFCLPSTELKTWAEQFGYSMVEAMACGKPVVSTLTGSIPEVVKDRATGILVKPNNAVELQTALEELLVNKQERETFGKNARSWVLQKFEANMIASQLAGIYREFI